MGGSTAKRKGGNPYLKQYKREIKASCQSAPAACDARLSPPAPRPGAVAGNS